jgi:hypothetical protein
MIITAEFLVTLQEKTRFLDVITDIVSREHRCMLERFIAVVCYFTLPKETKHLTVMGDIFDQVYTWKTPYKEYIRNKGKYTGVKLFKVWNDR